jgi:hypothetical protein
VKLYQYDRCAARPHGAHGAVCGGAPKDHNIRDRWVKVGVNVFSQHGFEIPR